MNQEIPKKKYQLDYKEEIENIYSAFIKFEIKEKLDYPKKKAIKKKVKPPKPIERESRPFAIKLISSNRASNKPMTLHMTKPETILEEEEASDEERHFTALELLKSEFDKSLSLTERTATEQYISETHSKLKYDNSGLMVPLMDQKYVEFFQLSQKRHPKKLIMYSISVEGLIDSCQQFSSIEDFNLPKKLKLNLFHLFLIFNSYTLFENNWSFIYNLLLKNAFFESTNIIDFTNIISSVWLTKFLLGEEFYESTKKPICNALTRQMFSILRKVENKLEKKRPMPVLESNHEIAVFGYKEKFYLDPNNSVFDKNKFKLDFYNTEDTKPLNGIGSGLNIEKVDFPVPEKKNIDRIEIEPVFQKSQNKRNDNRDLFKIFCNKIKYSNRIDFGTYIESSKRQLFISKLRKFNKFKKKKFKKVRNQHKKTKKYNGKLFN